MVCTACLLQPFLGVAGKSDFGKAFEKAHREQGAGGKFSFGGREYSTNRADGRDLRAEASRGSFSVSRSSGVRDGSAGDARRGSGGGASASVSRSSFGGSDSARRRSGADVSVSRGIQNNNPGNIRKTSIPWHGKVAGRDKSFETFDSPVNGIRALAKNTLTHFRRGENTVQKLINKHAPSSENPTASFVSRVANDMKVSKDETINMKDKTVLKAYVKSVIKHENSNYEYSDKVMGDAVDSALDNSRDEM